MTKRALITGVNGQDGSYLAELLLAQGYEVIGLDRNPPPQDLPSLAALDGHYVVDLMVPGALVQVVREAQPDELYHLAAHHFSSQTDENRLGRFEPFIRVNLLAANDALEVIASEVPGCRFFYAASAQIFGATATSPQDEATPRRPDTPYAISKSAGVDLCRYFRMSRGVFASVGILYNHESPRRGPSFITTQIARAAALASLGQPEPLVVRDLEAIVDWGAALDYVRAMWLSLQQAEAGEYVIASGVPRSIHGFAETAFGVVGLKADEYVHDAGQRSVDGRLPYVGDSTKLKKITGWSPLVGFDDLVGAMVESQIALHGPHKG